MMPAWCCSPIALYILSPSTTSSLGLIGSSGARHGLSVKAVSVPVGRQRFLPAPPRAHDLEPRQRDRQAACAAHHGSPRESELRHGFTPPPVDRGTRRSA